MNRNDISNSACNIYNALPSARIARSKGELPMSHWTWRTLIRAVYDINPVAAEDALTVSTMRKYFLKPSGCYTTSKYKNQTVFYKLNKPFIKSLTESDVLEIIEMQKPKYKKLRNERIDCEVEQLLRKVTIMVATGMFCTPEEAISCCIANKCFDNLYRRALDVLKEQDVFMINMYNSLEVHTDWHRECIYLFEHDIEAYANLMYANKYFSRRDVCFIMLEKWLNAMSRASNSSMVKQKIASP